MHEEEEDIQGVFVGYFSKLFTTKGNLDMEEVLRVVSCKATDDMQNELAQLFMEEEVTKALFQMHPCKAPGPDGMSAIFF